MLVMTKKRDCGYLTLTVRIFTYLSWKLITEVVYNNFFYKALSKPFSELVFSLKIKIKITLLIS